MMQWRTSLAKIYDQEFLTSLIHDGVQAVKRNLKVDWTEPHRDAVRAEVRAAVGRVLRVREVRREHFDFLIERTMERPRRCTPIGPCRHDAAGRRVSWASIRARQSPFSAGLPRAGRLAFRDTTKAVVRPRRSPG
jgi:hypothetical protein